MIELSFLLVTTLLFILGASIGSFLSVLILRSIEGETWVKGRSRCDYCFTQISWYDNIPLLSYFMLGGKCRNCHKPILPIHPMIELLTATLFVWWYWGGFIFFKLTQTPFSFLQPSFWLLVGLLFIYIFIIDLNYMIIPDRAVLALGVLAILYRLSLTASGIMQIDDLFYTVIASVVTSLFFFGLWYFTGGKGMGFGDVKIVIPLSLLLGPNKTIVAMFLSFILGSLVGVILMMFGGKNMKTKIPFGPFLIVSTVISLLFGEKMFSLYLSLLGM